MPCWCVFATWIRQFVWNISSFAYMCVWVHLSFWWPFRMFYFVWHLFVSCRANLRFCEFSNLRFFVCPSVILCDFSSKSRSKYRLTVKPFRTKFSEISRAISLKNSREQRTKFVEIRLHYFCTILYQCGDCPEKPGLCAAPCFRLFHTQPDLNSP